MPVLEKLIPHIDNEQLHVGEAYSIWTQIMSRYDTLELAQFIQNYIHDKDFKLLMNNGINRIIEPQIKRLEEFANKYSITLPARPPQSNSITVNTDLRRDENIFRIVFDGAQTALNIHVKAINIATNDELRDMFRGFLNSELDNYDALLKYGKLKGWVKAPPHYH